MTNTSAQLISASLAILRSGGWVRVQTADQSYDLREAQAGGPVQLMSNRLAENLGHADTDKHPDEPILLNDGLELLSGLSSELCNGILALLKMAHVRPACEIVVAADELANVTIDEASLLSLNGPVFPLVFNHRVTLPTAWSEKTELHLFSEQQDAKREHLAAICQNTNLDEPPLVRVHSKCVTGDIFDSFRCDCGEQLGIAKQLIGASGNGILIYLDQEGRGIGLRNKLAAYTLQDTGTDTFEANHQLGYEADERTYQAAITMLQHLGVSRIRLLTNNPDKIDQLGSSIEVVERVPLIAADEPNRQSYIDAKKQSGHLL